MLTGLGFKVILIGARALHLYGVLRETRDWDFTVDAPYTPEVRDRITSALRALGCAVQWRKWGFYVDCGGAHVDVNYAPLTLDDAFLKRCRRVGDVLLPSAEDLIILKAMSGERKDVEDIKEILRRVDLDLDYLLKRASEAGVEKELKKLLKRVGRG